MAIMGNTQNVSIHNLPHSTISSKIHWTLRCTPSSQQSLSSSAFKATFKAFHHTLEGTRLNHQEKAAKIPQKINRFTTKNSPPPPPTADNKRKTPDSLITL